MHGAFGTANGTKGRARAREIDNARNVSPNKRTTSRGPARYYCEISCSSATGARCAGCKGRSKGEERRGTEKERASLARRWTNFLSAAHETKTATYARARTQLGMVSVSQLYFRAGGHRKIFALQSFRMYDSRRLKSAIDETRHSACTPGVWKRTHVHRAARSGTSVKRNRGD